MDKGDSPAGGPAARSFVDQVVAGLAATFQCGIQVRDAIAYVMNAGAVFFEKLRDRAILGSRLKKLKMHISCSEKRSADFL